MADHKTKTLRKRKSFNVIVCQEKGCKFFGQETRQGVCFHDHGDVADWDKLARYEQLINQELKEVEELYEDKPDKLVKWLKAMYVNAMVNWHMGLDEMIRLRRDLSLLIARTPTAKPMRVPK